MGDIVRVVLEGKVQESGPHGFNLTGLFYIHPDQEEVESIEIIKPPRPSVADLPVGSVVQDTDLLVYIKRAHDTWRGTDGLEYQDCALDFMGWMQFVPKESE